MARKHKISVFMPVQNVADIIRPALESVQWADEVFVVDAYSTDRTVEICKEYPNVKVVQHEYENSGAQRTWGMPKVSHEWVFILDSDERCTPELQKEIEQILSQDEIPYDGFFVHLKTRFYGRLQNHDRYLGYKGMRLVRKSGYTQYKLRRVHSKLDIKNRSMIKNKKAYIIHEPIRDFKSHQQKMARYAQWAAEDMFEQGKKARWYHFTLRPFYKFINHYFFKLGFLDGLRGLILCSIAAQAVFLKYYSLFVLQHRHLVEKEEK